MILKSGHSRQYLIDVRNGKIKEGLGLNSTIFDQHVRYKQGQMNMVLGTDNVGKSYAVIWYALAISSHHDVKWTIWMGEDEPGETMINLIQMYSGKPYQYLTEDEIVGYELKIENWFQFVDPKLSYSPAELMKIFEESNSDAFILDPFTGLKRGFGHSDNYEFLNMVREFCNSRNKTVYITLHPSTESGRSSGLHIKDSEFEGHIKPPKKADAEGGQAFANRADDFWILHRYTQHDAYKTITMLHVVKNKRNRTGGSPTGKDTPIYMEFNNGLGFLVEGNDLIKRPERKPSPLSRPNPMPQEIQNFYEVLDKDDEFKPIDDDVPF